jgi:hypothetical protein
MKTFIGDTPLLYMNSRKEVKIIRHNLIVISLWLAACFGFCESLHQALENINT